jgi:hypothetical protein
MVYMWFTGINYYKLAVEKDRDSIFTARLKKTNETFSSRLMNLVLGCMCLLLSIPNFRKDKRF